MEDRLSNSLRLVRLHGHRWTPPRSRTRAPCRVEHLGLNFHLVPVSIIAFYALSHSSAPWSMLRTRTLVDLLTMGHSVFPLDRPSFPLRPLATVLPLETHQRPPVGLGDDIYRGVQSPVSPGHGMNSLQFPRPPSLSSSSSSSSGGLPFSNLVHPIERAIGR